MLKLQKQSLEWALSCALRYGDTDVFPLPFEYHAIKFDWGRIGEYLARQNILEWTTRPHRMLLAPKSKCAFRVVTQLDPLDFLLFSATVKEIAEDIEAKRLPVNANRVFSYRVKIGSNGQFFDPDVGYREFINTCHEKISNNDSVKFVGIADISDFYLKIYHHRLINALYAATSHSSHVSAIERFLSGWNGTETFGIPIGVAASRILAEATISDIDEALLAREIDFIRFNDDYRIFADSYETAYRNITILADFLFKNHGLTLQAQKTDVLEKDEFQRRFLTTPIDREMNSLHERFEELIELIDLDNWYDVIEYDDLDEEAQEIIDTLNLSRLFQDEINKDEPDFPVVKFVLRRLGQLGDDSILNDVFSAIHKLNPAFPDVIRYMKSLRYLNNSGRKSIGEKILDLLDGSVLSELPYNKMWMLDMFTYSREWDNEDRFCTLYALESDSVCKRKLILAMGRAHQQHWFQSQWRNLFDHTPWARRAVLAGASCLPADARNHWYSWAEPRLDELENAIVRYVKDSPF